MFSTGTPSSTVDHVQALEAFAQQDPERYRFRMGMLGALAQDFASSCPTGDVAMITHATRFANHQLAALGGEIGMPIVTPALAAAAKLAEDLGGAAKPSGAGGGDVGIAFLTDPEAAATFRKRALHIGLEILSIRTGARGLRREPSARERNHVER